MLRIVKSEGAAAEPTPGTRIVGRQRELSEIDRALAERRGGVLLLVGEPGIGKSTLADELVARAGAAGRVTAWGSAWEAGGAPAFWPWAQVLRTLSRKPGLLGDGAPELLQRLSSDARDHAADRPSAGPSADRFALFDAVARALEAASERAPLAIVLEDVHAADLPTLGLFELAVRELRDSPILFVATYRDVEARAEPEIDAVLGRVRRHANVLHLQRLGQDAIQDLLTQRLGPRSVEDVARLHETTGGNPLFVSELLRVLETDPAALDGERLPRSDGLRAAIREHMRHLGPELRSVLDVASVIGREVALLPLLGLLARDGDDRDERRGFVERCLREAVTRGVLHEHGLERYRFTHVLLRDTLHADLEPRVRSELHVRYADWLQSTHALSREGAAAGASEIAHHLLAAGPAHVARAADAACFAAQDAVRSLGFEHAADLCSRALDALDIARAAEPDRRFELLVLLGTARFHVGDVAGGKAVCAQAAELARRQRDPIRLARAALAYGTAYVFAVVDPVLVGLCEESLRDLPGSELELRARVMARLAAAMQPAEDTSGPVLVAREAMALGAQTNDERVELAVNFAAMSAMMDIVDPRERAPLNERMVKLAQKLGDRAVALHAQRRLIIDHLDLGDMQRAKFLISAYADASKDMPQRHVRWQLPMFRSAVAMVEGRFDDHLRDFEEAKSLAAPLGPGSHHFVIVLHAMMSARVRDRIDELPAAMAAIRPVMPPVASYVDIFEAMVAVRTGDLTTARELLARNSLRTIEVHGDVMLNAVAGEVAVALHDLEWARAIRTSLEPHLHEACSWGLVGMAVEGPALHPMSLMCALLGDWNEAKRHFENGLAWMHKTGSAPFECRARIEWAERLVERGRAEDRAEIAQHASIARELAERFGLPSLLERAQHLGAHSSGATKPPSLAPRTTAAQESAPCCTIANQGDVWSLHLNGRLCQLKDSRGLAFLARLIEQPGRELHVLDLVGAPDEVRFEDGGELIDREARDAYRARVNELREEIEDARAAQQPERAERFEAELEALQNELARGLSLGGRARKASTAAEKARVNVQRRIADSLRRVREQDKTLADHLEACIRTGIYCVYSPERAK